MTDPRLRVLTQEGLRVRTEEAAQQLHAAAPGRDSVQMAEGYCRAIRSCPSHWAYHQFSEEVLNTRDAVRGVGGVALVAAFHRYTLLRLVPETWRTLQERPHLAPVLEWFEDAIAQVISDLGAMPDADLDLRADPFARDLATAALRAWPLGAALVEPRLRMPRRWMLQGGPWTLLRGLGLLARLGGTFPLYQIHATTRHLSEFSEPGWEDCYRRIAYIMSREPAVRGLMGGAWIFDPELERVSPRLAYMRRLPFENGALIARVPSTPDTYACALKKSATRRRLYEAGQYEPRQYALVWPRRDFLRWARID